VLIGSGIDTPALGKELEACEDDAPQADELGMWGVLRYVRSPDEPDFAEPGAPAAAADLEDPPAWTSA
jgi:hypothetical protein